MLFRSDHAEVTLKALALGAADYIPKPAAEGGVMTSVTFQRELIEKIRSEIRARRRQSVHAVLLPSRGPGRWPAVRSVLAAEVAPVLVVVNSEISPPGP